MTLTDEAPRRPRVIVLDSGALISGSESLYSLKGLRTRDNEPLSELEKGEEVQFFTIPDILSEVRDANARARLELLGDALQLRVPSSESLAAVVRFAKASGDYTALSLVDLRVMALARMLEYERNGTQYLRDQPVLPEISPSRGIPAYILDEAEKEREENENKDREGEDEWTTVPAKQKATSTRKRGKRKPRRHVPQTAPANATKLNDSGVSPEQTDASVPASQPVAEAKLVLEAPTAVRVGVDGEAAMVDKVSSLENEWVCAMTRESVSDGSSDSDGGGWINCDNIEEHLSKDGKDQSCAVDDDERVGCVTTDFAMQNVLLQMGIKLISIDGKRTIRQIRRYVLRCHACAAITRELERKFCDKCGNATLHRVAFKVNRKGVARVFINPRRRPNLRGTRYSIPMPKGGRNNKDLILREDQVDIAKQRRLEKQMAKLNVDVLDPNAFYNAGAKFNPHDNRIVVGYGRRNPNESRPGSKSKKKK